MGVIALVKIHHYVALVFIMFCFALFMIGECACKVSDILQLSAP